MAPKNPRPSSHTPHPPTARLRTILVSFLAGAILAAVFGWMIGMRPARHLANTSRANLAPSSPANDPDSISFDGKEGPWGRLEYTPISIAPPRELYDAELDLAQTRWTLPGYTRQEAEKVFSDAGLLEAERAILAASAWKTDKDAVSVVVPASIILRLSPDVRTKLYAILAQFPQNLQANPLAYLRSELDDRLAHSGLAPQTIDLCKRLIYGIEPHAFLADDRTLLSQIPDKEERLNLILLLVRADTYAVRLRIRPESNLAQMVEYWGRAGRAKDVAPIFQSLQAVPGGYRLDLAHLLPGIARRRIYTYPRPGLSGDTNKNCHWTSFNFHSDVADDRFIDIAAAKKELETQYLQVTTPAFADLVILVDKDNSAVVHSAVYLADDLVFTKNGYGLLQPWVYMHVRPMVNLYSAKLGKPDGVKALLFRRKTKEE